MLDWSQIIYHRDKIHERYRKIWDIPLIKRRFSLVDKNLCSGMRLLDVGLESEGWKLKS